MVDGEIDVSMATLHWPQRRVKDKMRITIYCVVVLPDIVKRSESHLFCLKNQAKFEFCLLSLNLNYFVRSGRGRKCRCCMLGVCLVCCGRGAIEANKKTYSFVPAFCLLVGQGLLNVDGRLPAIMSLASWRPCVSEPKRRPWRARLLAHRPRFLFCFLLFVVGECARVVARC